MTAVLDFLLVVALIAIAVVFARVGLRFLLDGKEDVRQMRREGGGLSAWWKGELSDGHGSARAEQGHGLHIRVNRNDRVEYRQKSKVV